MKKSVKKCTAMFLIMSLFTVIPLFAQQEEVTQLRQNTTSGLISGQKTPPDKSMRPDPNMMPEPDKLTGTIQTKGRKKSLKCYLITEDGRKILLETIELPEFNRQKNKKDKDCRDERNSFNRKDDFADRGKKHDIEGNSPEKMKRPPKPVTKAELAKLDGKQVTIIGHFDDDDNEFEVMQILPEEKPKMTE